MDKINARYMRYGKLVQSSLTQEIFCLVEDMSAEKETVLVVNIKNYERYKLIASWLGYWEWDMAFRTRFNGNIEDCALEKKAYAEELKVIDVEPYNQIRFITSSYNPCFEVLDLSCVTINGTIVQVYYIDDTHFGLLGASVGFQGTFHICEFADMREKLNLEIKPYVAETEI